MAMNRCIESLETRRFFSSTIHADDVLIVTEERALVSLSTDANHEQTLVRNALHADLARLRVLRTNARLFNTLARDEVAGIHRLYKDAHTLAVATNADQSRLLQHTFDFQQHPTNPAIKAAFSSTLARLQRDEVADQNLVLSDSTADSTGASLTDLTAIAAIDPTDITLQTDAQTGIAGLAASSTSLFAAVGLLQGDVAALIADSSGLEFFGNQNLLGLGYTVRANPFAGATLKGLATDATSISTTKYAGPTTIAPTAGDFPGTDQIYVGSTQTVAPGQLAGPQVLTLDYSSLTRLGHPIRSLTLGIATDGFENPTIHSPYTATINGLANPTLTALLNSIDGAGRVEQFVSIGIDPALLSPSQMLTVTINGPGGSGWAIDFLTAGVRNG